VSSSGKAPVEGLRDIPQKLKQFSVGVLYRVCLQKQSRFENFAQFTFLILDQYHGGVS